MLNNCFTCLLCAKDTTVSKKECVLFFFPNSPVKYVIILSFFKDIFKTILYFGKCVIKSTSTYWNVIYSWGYRKDRLNWKSEELLGRCEWVWLTALCHKTDYHWLVYRQVTHTDIIISRAVGFICHLFNVSSLYCYLFSAWGIIIKHFLSLFLE
jgi:hypothetical protein